MSGAEDPLVALRATARLVLGRVDDLPERWRSGALVESELDDLARAVWLLRVDLELHAASPTDRDATLVLVRIREGIDAAIAIVTGLLEGAAAPSASDRGR